MEPITPKMIADVAQFGCSGPGDSVHRLAAGITDSTGTLTWKIYYIEFGPEQDLIAQTIDRAKKEATAVGRARVVVLATEISDLNIPADADEEYHRRARALQAAGLRHTHPDMAEITFLYAAARDGRRWRGHHFLTGRDAGLIEGPTLLTGPLTVQDDVPYGDLIRRAAGLRW